MDHFAGGCKGLMDAAATSDHPDMMSHAKCVASHMAKGVGDMFESGSKMFPEHVSEFEEPAALAQTYDALDDEEDATEAGDTEEEELLDEENNSEKGEKDEADRDGHDLGEDDETVDDGHPEKGMREELVTVKLFEEWHSKTFGETNAKEYLDGLVEQVRELKEKVESQQEALEINEPEFVKRFR